MARFDRSPLAAPRAALVALALALPLPALALAAEPAAALVMFSSPSRNIGCAIDRGFARCDVADHSWRAPAKPKRCMLDWGNGVTVGKRGRAQFVCAGDTVLQQRGAILGYGRSRTVGSFTCTSRRSGMTCSRGGSGHGFFVSKTRAKIF
ncbi:hypothetical protein Q5424_20590 [Conexibacter sp. JD483]|uniref:DUF6636 domain-containing protein n=1 Tax=unclassified Conexibacter TaxID=2627773 RepID=UPI0027189321|nr:MULTISPECIES: DUF6636 domain-containing protein [unclassified Conexibacter]MDO8188986.1 hypothetical protein [Conexibacter sp. CPCC 205706]MDO8201802.1 hypothetical protein [Conexibacter sp. CPCC 205762]MDR9371509.1 hypothetical protein [Conexibacter sp. JD483]